MTIIVCIPAHGASIKGKSILVDTGYVLSPVRAGDVMHFATFNIISKILLEAANSTDPAKELQRRIEWFADIPTTEIVRPGQKINEFSFASAFEILSKDYHFLPLEHLKGKYGDYIDCHMKDRQHEYKIYINKQVLKNTITFTMPKHTSRTIQPCFYMSFSRWCSNICSTLWSWRMHSLRYISMFKKNAYFSFIRYGRG